MWLLAIGVLAALLSGMCIAVVFALRSPLPPGAASDPARSSASAGLRWAAIFAANLSAAAVGFVGGALSAGLLALGQAIWCGVSLGRLIGGLAAVSRDMGGPGLISVATAGLLPHGLLEFPAFVLVWAVSARRGLALAAALRRGRLRSALQSVRGDLRLLLLAAVPLLLVSAILEDRVNPAFMDRFLLGIGRFRAIGAERRIGPLLACSQVTLSPEGDGIAAVGSAGSRLALLDSGSGAVRVLPRPPEGSHLSPAEGSPS
jgi:uncharacterized membrane protein SpoIIM required for sporulation